jgi:hypothetical protein
MRIRRGVVNELLHAMTDDAPVLERMRRVSELQASDEEMRAATHLLAGATLDALRDAGVLVPSAPGVMDLTVRSLQALAAVYGILSRWDVVLNPDRTLGSAMKIIATDDAARIEQMLRFGALLPAANDQDDLQARP